MASEATSQDPVEERRDGAWPRIYRPTPSQRRSALVSGVVGIVLGAGMLIGAPFLWTQTAATAVVFALVGLGLVLSFAYLLAGSRHQRVTLFEDAVEIVWLDGRPQRMRRDEIAGWRYVAGYYVAFEPRDPSLKPLKASFTCERDAVFDAWFEPFPNLDALDRERDERELLQRPELGRDEGERRRSLARARTIAIGAAVLTFAVAFWAMLRPWSPAALGVTAAIPLAMLALLRAGHGCFTLVPQAHTVRAPLMVPLMLPGAVLAACAFAGSHLLDWRMVVVVTVIGTVALTAAILGLDPVVRRHWLPLLVVVPILAAYPFGAVRSVNVRLDRAAPERFHVEVLEKRITPGKCPTHTLRLAAWGPVASEEREVDRDLYDGVDVGGAICTVLHPGALGLRWFTLGLCEDRTLAMAAEAARPAEQDCRRNRRAAPRTP